MCQEKLLILLSNKEDIKKCIDPTGLNLPVEKFVEICLEAMKKIAAEIGL